MGRFAGGDCPGSGMEVEGLSDESNKIGRSSWLGYSAF